MRHVHLAMIHSGSRTLIGCTAAGSRRRKENRHVR